VGRFELWQTQVEGRDEVGESTTFLLIEGAHRADRAAGLLGRRSAHDEGDDYAAFETSLERG
jgi:hypothetical protein